MSRYLFRSAAYNTAAGPLSELRLRRLHAGISQARLAELAGVSERTVRSHEMADWPNAKAEGRAVHRRLLTALRDL